MTKQARGGGGMKGRGIAPDEYIPFQPEEITRDTLLEAALARGTD